MVVPERAKQDNEVDDLVDLALAELKTSSGTAPPRTKPVQKDAELDDLIEEFQAISRECTTEEDTTEQKERIDQAFEKLLSIAELPQNATVDSIADTKIDEMIEQMMTELTSRELLAEPFDKLAKAYPAWIEKHRSSLEKSTLQCYEKQCQIVIAIDALFKENTVVQSAEDHHRKVFELMQQMQELGSPPEDIVNSLDTSRESNMSGCTQM